MLRYKRQIRTNSGGNKVSKDKHKNKIGITEDGEAIHSWDTIFRLQGYTGLYDTHQQAAERREKEEAERLKKEKENE